MARVQHALRRARERWGRALSCGSAAEAGAVAPAHLLLPELQQLQLLPLAELHHDAAARPPLGHRRRRHQRVVGRAACSCCVIVAVIVDVVCGAALRWRRSFGGGVRCQGHFGARCGAHGAPAHAARFRCGTPQRRGLTTQRCNAHGRPGRRQPRTWCRRRGARVLRRRRASMKRSRRVRERRRRRRRNHALLRDEPREATTQRRNVRLTRSLRRHAPRQPTNTRGAARWADVRSSKPPPLARADAAVTHATRLGDGAAGGGGERRHLPRLPLARALHRGRGGDGPPVRRVRDACAPPPSCVASSAVRVGTLISSARAGSAEPSPCPRRRLAARRGARTDEPATREQATRTRTPLAAA